jgi:hypothetical protein
MRPVDIKSFLIIAVIALICFYGNSAAQDKKPRISPKAGVSQIIGTTEVKISYSRPGVKGRKIWGELVPYNKVWRAGADEATKFTFANDVKINGKKIPAGSYSFFVIPSNGEWTLILNKVADQWGAFEYNENKDLIRFKVSPQKNGYQEWLSYSFSGMSTGMAYIDLSWEYLKVSLKVEAK